MVFFLYKTNNSNNTLLGGNGDGKEVMLVFPGKYRAPNPQVPLGLLHVASPLVQEGYAVRILDMRVDDYRSFNVGSPVFVGISCMSGLQIRYGLEFAKKIREEHPSCPIVWGGVHPTLLPEQTAASPYVDIIVRGEGESTITELAGKLGAEQSIADVAGITYKSEEGRIRSNPDGQLVELDEIPVDLPFKLLRLDKYPSLRAGRFHIQTSRGCPHRCGYCFNSFFNKRRWRGKSAERVLDEIEYVLEKYPNVKIIDPIDDNFFVDKERVEDICAGMMKRGIDVTWRANCRFDYLCGYDQNFIDLLERSGCTELDFGGETGSERLLSLIAKDITPDQMVKSVENLKKFGSSIAVYVSWMSGLPTETDEDLKKTFDLMDKMSEVYPKTQHYGIFVFTPFPAPLVESLGTEFELPQSLDDWGDIDVFHFNPPWHSEKYVKRLQAIAAVTKYAFYPSDRIAEGSLPYRLGYKMLNKAAMFRWRHRCFGLPVELNAVNAAVRKFRGYL
jgi:anaerobic magnesium-protoporphyrin IX monomethyl ester cyclase